MIDDARPPAGSSGRSAMVSRPQNHANIDRRLNLKEEEFQAEARSAPAM
jgi:hypothetical protein